MRKQRDITSYAADSRHAATGSLPRMRRDRALCRLCVLSGNCNVLMTRWKRVEQAHVWRLVGSMSPHALGAGGYTISMISFVERGRRGKARYGEQFFPTDPHLRR